MKPEDVHAVTLKRVIDGIALRWEWPSGISRVSIARHESDSDDQWDESKVKWFDYTEAEYRDNGGLYLDHFGTGAPARHFRYTVYARDMKVEDGELSPGSSEDCRAEIEWRPWNVFSYRISAIKSSSPAVLFQYQLQSPENDLPGYVIMASRSGMPEGLDDPHAIELFRRNIAVRSGSGEEEILLESVRALGWPRFYLRAFALNPASQESTIFEHPDSMIPISRDGVIQTAERNGSFPSFRAGVPKEVICPHCLSKFPVQDMMFALSKEDSDGDSEPRRGRYGIGHRLLGWPPTPPKDRFGRRFGKRHCFHCDRELPASAHAQDGLIIGLIGAQYSGKSHYIASLIHQLKSVAGAFDGGLLHLDDATLKREQAMLETLFKFREPLPKTTGTPDPLLYDFRIGGSVWGESGDRNVTLVLYETAGENLDDRKVAEKMVQYLSVASGVVFLLDPLEMPELKQRIPESARREAAQREGSAASADPGTVLGNVLELLDRDTETGGRLEVPIAVALSKCDYLRDAGIISQQSMWNSQKRHEFFFNRTLADDISGRFGGMMNRWSEDAYNNIRSRFASHAFFGVSATGCAPDPDTGEFPFVSPWRVEDPLLWLLAELGVIPSRREI